MVYMMHSTTSPLDARVRERMVPLLEEDPGKPEGLLSSPDKVAAVIEVAREQVAAWCGAGPGEIVFTSGGTESCNLALKGVALAARASGREAGRLLAASTEHTAVLYPLRTLTKLGFETFEVPVDRHGVVDPACLPGMLAPKTLLVSIALANAETGTLQSIREIAGIVHEHGALVHTDACLAAAGGPIDVKELGVDLASFSAHKIGGPRGVGALYVRHGVRLLPLIEGGVNEAGRRGGTEYVAGIAGFGVAASNARAEIARVADRLAELDARLLEGLTSIEGVSLNGHPAARLPGMISVSVPGIDGEALVVRLGRKGIAVSSGSSCFQEAGKPSHVLMAMGLEPGRSKGTVLFSLGRDTTAGEIDEVLRVFPEIVDSLRGIAVKHRR